MIIVQIDKAIRRKEELKFYTDTLKELHKRQSKIQREIKLTSDIIKIIESESIKGDNNE